MAWTSWEKVAGFDFKEVIYEKKYHVELEGGVARITMNRPDRMNNYSSTMTREMGIAYNDASDDPMIGVVVLTGAGDRAFSTGGDVAGELEAARAGVAYQAAGRPEEQERPRGTSRTCRKPVIARVNGFCIGGGHHLALECDITIAAEHAIFGHNGPRVASAPDGDYISYLTYLIGAKKAREMNFLCRRYIAQEALEMGLINKVVHFDKLDEEVDKWCEDILRASPTCIEIRKRSFDVQLDLGGHLGGPRGAIKQWVAPDFAGSPENVEGGTAFLEKRPTRFWKIRKAELEASKKRG